MRNDSVKQIVTKEFFFVALMWLAFQGVWYACFGLHFDLESLKYIREAQFILEHHHLSEGRYLFYLSTTLIIALSQFVGLSLPGALLLIMGVNLVSYLYFFKALRHLFRDRLPAFLVVFLLVSFWPYQSWSLYLYTETFFYSAVLLLFSHLLLYQRLNLRFLLSTLLLLLLVVISRPLGVLFIFPTLLFLYIKTPKRQSFYFGIATLVSILVFNFIVQTVLTTTSDWSLKKTIQEADLICDIPGPDSGRSLDLSDHSSQLYQLIYYITHNFTHFAGLALLRLKLFYTMVRNYYSDFHNLYIVFYLISIYASIVLGFGKIKRCLPPGICLFILSTIVLFSITIALQCDDYHNRFFLTLMPFFFVMTIVVLWPLLKDPAFLRRKEP